MRHARLGARNVAHAPEVARRVSTPAEHVHRRCQAVWRAGKRPDFVAEALDPKIDNQAVQEARRLTQWRLDGLDGEVNQPEPL
jgi:hypothetical protein